MTRSKVKESGLSFRLRWQFNRKSLIFLLTLFPITLALGLWQVQRGEQKEQLLNEFSEHQKQPYAPLLQLADSERLNYRKVEAQGYLDIKRTVLLDNQVFRGKPGYQVLTPLKLDDGSWLLVNRGWLVAAKDRHQLPRFEGLVSKVQLRGQLYRPKAFTLTQQEYSDQRPQLVQSIELEALSRYFDNRLAPYTMRIDPENPLAYIATWPVVTMSPHRHYAYAVQFFALALILLILSIFANSNIRDFFRRQ